MTPDALLNSIISQGPIEAEQKFAFAAFAALMEDMALLEMGVPYTELNISARRKSSMPFLVSAATGAQTPPAPTLPDPYFDEAIAVIPLKGYMRVSGGLSSYGAEDVADSLYSAYRNPKISAVVMSVYTGGGAVDAGTLIESAVADRNKPVLTFGRLIASAGYRAVSGTDEIILDPAGEAGSIGTMITIDKDFLEQYKTRFLTLYAKRAKDKNKEMRALADNEDTAPLEAYLEEINDQFLEKVMANRQLKGGETMVNNTLSGGMFTAEQAKRRGLVDMIGNFSTAIARARSWAKRTT